MKYAVDNIALDGFINLAWRQTKKLNLFGSRLQASSSSTVS